MLSAFRPLPLSNCTAAISRTKARTRAPTDATAFFCKELRLPPILQDVGAVFGRPRTWNERTAMIKPVSYCSTVRNRARRGKRRAVLLIDAGLVNAGGAQGKTPSLPEATSQLAVSLLATLRRKEPRRESAEKAVSTRDSSMASPWCASPRLASGGEGGFLCGWGLEDVRQPVAATRGARR